MRAGRQKRQLGWAGGIAALGGESPVGIGDRPWVKGEESSTRRAAAADANEAIAGVADDQLLQTSSPRAVRSRDPGRECPHPRVAGMGRGDRSLKVGDISEVAAGLQRSRQVDGLRSHDDRFVEVAAIEAPICAHHTECAGPRRRVGRLDRIVGEQQRFCGSSEVSEAVRGFAGKLGRLK